MPECSATRTAFGPVTQSMPAAPSLSVVIPCYNASRWIDATLRSVLGQHWPGQLEVVVVDDGSKDDSAERVAMHAAPVRLVQQRNAGVAAARNHGIELAQGEWVAFIDADDIWLPGKLAAQWATLQARPDAAMSCTGWHVWSSDEPEPDPELVEQLAQAPQGDARWTGPNGWVYPELLLSCEVWTSTVMVRRQLLRELGGFDTSLRIGEDYDLWLRASRLTRIERVQRPLALYRMHPGSLTKTAPAENYQAVVVQRALRRWGYESPDGNRADQYAVQAGLALSWRDFAGAHLRAGSIGKACFGSRAALRHQPLQWRNWQLALQCHAAHLWRRSGPA